MKKLLILSGKGGTGKTTTAAAFIRFSKADAIADCDVDAPNLHLVTQRNTAPNTTEFIGAQKAWIDSEKCIGCKKCMNYCRFQAIEYAKGVCQTKEYACEGCGVCEYVCPTQAVNMKDDVAGTLELYQETPVFSTAELKMGRGNSGKLVTAVKTALLKGAPDSKLAIIDGSPGIGCPVIASVSGMDMVLIVTEPTVSGVSDLERLLETTAVFHTKTAVCVNKWDVNSKQTERIQQFCKKHAILFAGRIPYDKTVSKAINEGLSIADYDCPARTALLEVYSNIIKNLKGE